MKRLIDKLAIVGIVAVLALCAVNGQSLAQTSNLVDIDVAIQRASDAINAQLTPGIKVALLNFTSPTKELSDYVIEEMSIHLVNGKKLTVVDRKEIELIRGELIFQMSGEVSDESAQEVGRMLGAQFIISGSLTSMSDSYRFR
jgi:TolB-like protein